MRIYHTAISLLLLLGALAGPSVALSAVPVQRFVLAAGANDGGAGRSVLRYAVTDAEQFGEIMVQMGGVDPSDRILLREATRTDLEQAVADLAARVASSPGGATRSEVILYYSGHADETGLLLAGELLPYQEFRRMMDAIDADMSITVLDACASGAITRIKGGQRQEAFLLDTSSDTRGCAFLTSSSAEESAQESDRIGASFFTYYLISGLRGAADVSGDGRVTLHEAYDFAYTETLARTVDLQGGAQHATHDMDLIGTGGVVMTDLRQMSAGVALIEGFGGRLFVRNESRQLVAELYKPEDRAVELGLEPDQYEIYLDQKPDLRRATFQVQAGEHLQLAAADFELVAREAAVGRGGPVWDEPLRRAGPGAADLGRWRVELHLGKLGPEPQRREAYQEAAPADDWLRATVGEAVTWGPLAGLSLGYWLGDDVEIRLSYATLSSDYPTGATTADGRLVEDIRLTSVLLGVRRYLLLPGPWGRVRPHVSTAVGSFQGMEKGRRWDREGETWSETRGALGARMGAGVEVCLNRRLALGLSGGYNLMSDFAEPIGERRNYSGPEFDISVSLLFGGER